MKITTLITCTNILAATVVGAPDLLAAKKQKEQLILTATGKKLEANYARQLEALKTELTQALPSVSSAKKSAFIEAREAEIAATKQIEEARKKMGEIASAKGLVGHAKGKWIGGANKGIAAAEAKLKNAKTAAEREEAKKDLAHWQQNKKDGEAALKERQAKLEAALKNKDQYEQTLRDAEKTLAEAKAATIAAVKDLGLTGQLSSNKLDAKLARYSVLAEATPARLAAFAQQSKKRGELIDKMLSANELLVQMAVADGAKDGNYGAAMEIYSKIWQASDKVAEDPLRRLALAISLEHATPIKQRNAESKKDAPEFVDPVERYLNYEKALLNGELDPAFKNLTVWEYRMVIDGEEPNEILTWGREMLRNYRPDHVTTEDYRWRYVALVRSDIPYGSQDNKYDKPELQFFQNILMNGGICGRRAFIGRFTLRAFGIPTTARPQRGHAALVHWTPDGWVPCLGAGWGSGWTKGRYDKDLDFLATTQARAAGEPFMMVKRAQWIGDVAGEPRVYGLQSRTKPEFWYGASLYIQKDVIENARSKTLDAVGQDIAEATETKEKVAITKVTITEKDRNVSVDSKGIITIPAAATTKPTKSGGKIIFMDSVLGGKQLHYSRTSGGHQNFEYTIEAPAAGKYQLTAHVVTPSWRQYLLVSVNGAKEKAELHLPHTVGLWDKSETVVVELKKGKNILTFSREGNVKGVSIKDFTLTPTSGRVTRK